MTDQAVLVAPGEKTPPQTQQEGKIRLEYLDGMRGLAALFVVLLHIYDDCHHVLVNSSNSVANRIARDFLFLVHSTPPGGVSAFIVLSGYVLTIPLVRGQAVPLALNLKDFALRRARRIIPPYYAALAGCLALVAAIPVLRQINGTCWDASLPAFGVANIVTHMLLIHDLVNHYNQTIDYPMWSVGTEWQIYFLFAFILVPLWRKTNVYVTLIAAAVLAYAPYLFYTQPLHFWGSEMLLAFGLGMFAAYVGFAVDAKINKIADSKIWYLLFFVGWALCVVMEQKSATATFFDRRIEAVIVDIVAFSTIILCTRAIQTRQTCVISWVVKLFEAKISKLLGSFSYSLYLIHGPLWALCFDYMMKARMSPAAITYVSVFLLTPAICAVAYLFHLAFEKPFMAKRGFKTSLEKLSAFKA